MATVNMLPSTDGQFLDGSERATCIDLHVAVDRVCTFDVDRSGAVPSAMGLINGVLASVEKPGICCRLLM